MKRHKNKEKKKVNRYKVFSIIVVLIFVVIISRLVFLQVIKGEHYREVAVNRTNRDFEEIAPRGSIIDANGVVLAQDEQGFSVTYTETAESKENFYETLQIIFEILEEHDENIEDNLALKIAPVRFEFNSTNITTIKSRELRFKRDRGLDDFFVKTGAIQGINNLDDFKNTESLNEEEKKLYDKLIEELLKFSPEDTFEYMLDFYKINNSIEILEKKEAFKELYEILKQKSPIELENLILNYSINSEIEEELIDGLFEKLYNDGSDDELLNLLKKYNIETVTIDDNEKRKYLLVKDDIRMQSYKGKKSVVIAGNIDKETAGIIMQLYEKLPGIDVKIDMNRVYPQGTLGADFIGYLSKISPLKEEEFKEKGYNVNVDYVGSSGIEDAFESQLRGIKGIVFAEINKQGRVIREVAEKPAYPGNDVELTIDANLQAVAESALEEALETQQSKKIHGNDNVDTTNASRGAAVVIDVNTGEILALASKPGFDPNMLSTPGMLTSDLQKLYFNPDLDEMGTLYVEELIERSAASRDVYEGLTTEEIVNKLFPIDTSIAKNTSIRQDRFDIFPKPLYNYATQAFLPPGSVFKPLMAVAALEEGVVSTSQKIKDGGYYTQTASGWKFHKSLHPGQTFNIYDALKKSNNFFFYRMGDLLYQKAYNQGDTNGGLDAIAEWAWKFGLGVPKGENPYTGIEISEKFGQVYNYESNKRTMVAINLKTLYDTYLIKGYDIKNNKYIPVNLNVDSNDIDKVIEVKNKIRDFISKKMVADNYYESEIRKELQIMLKELLDVDDELKNNYSKVLNENETKDNLEAAIQKQLAEVSLAIYRSIRNAHDETDNPNNLISASIGQGSNQFTPLQLAIYTATLANGGTRYKAHMVDSIKSPEGDILQEYKPEILDENLISQPTLNAVKEGMRRVVSVPGGTAYQAFKGFPLEHAGKTGSATFASYQEKIGRTSFATYIGFAPLENPEIAISVVVFDGGHGGEIAGVARAIYEEYFKETLKVEFPTYVLTYDNPTITNDAASNESTEADENLEINEEIEENE